MVSQPKAPDPYATAAAQNQQSQYASQYNSASGNVNEVNPYGTVSYQTMEQVPIYTNGVVTGYAPRYERTSTLSPDQQKLLGLETQGKYNLGTAAVEQSAKLREHLNTAVDPSKWEAWNRGVGPQELRQDQGPTDRAGIENAMMQSYERNAAPQERAKEAQLAARGLNAGSKGYGTVQQGTQDSRAEAARQAYLASGNESRLAQGAFNEAATQRYQMGQDYSSYLNNLRGAQAAEAYQSYNHPINAITALMSGSQATVPQFQPFQGSPISASNIGKYISDNYAARSQAAGATNAGIFGLMGNLAKAGMAIPTGGASLLTG